MEWKHTNEVLNRYGEYLKERLKQNLLEDGSNASGNLTNSINYIVEHKGTQFSVSISLLDYWKYLNYDTKPHFPPVNKIEEWIKVKRIIPEVRSLPNGKEYLPSVKQLAYLIARKINEFGTKGTGFFEKAVEEMNERFLFEIEEALSEDINEEIDILLVNL